MVSHTDEMAPFTYELGDLAAGRRQLGKLVQAEHVGLSRWDIPAHRRNAPLHNHADEEEIAWVLRGSGFSVQQPASGGELEAHPVSEGDCVVYGRGSLAHTFLAGDHGLDVLLFAEGSDTNITWLPRAQSMWLGPHWLPVDGEHPFVRESNAGPLTLPDPAPERAGNVVALDQAPTVDFENGPGKALGRFPGKAAGAKVSALNHMAIAPGREAAPPHCHSLEEELFVVLDGAGVVHIGEEEHDVRPGSIVSRPPGTGVAHWFTAGDDGLGVLAYSTKDPNDAAFYPRTGLVALRGLGVVFRPERVDPWSGGA